MLVGIRGALVHAPLVGTNAAFLKEALNVPEVTEALSRAVDRLGV
jgi:hypothetical protein